MSSRLSTALRVSAVALLCVTGRAPAQTATQADSGGPRTGAWGAEISSGSLFSASLLHFSSPSAAWMFGGSFSFSHQDFDRDNGTTTNHMTITSGSYDLQGGRRWWRGAARDAFRPLLGVGAISSFRSGSGLASVTGGLYGETGGSYFFGPHVSLGVTGQLSLEAGQAHSGSDQTSGQWFIRGEVARFTASVYF
jgi:hypothetical protein